MRTLYKVSQQTGWQLLGKGVSTLSTVIVLGLISRYYGEAGVGLYTLAITYLAFFFLAADFNLNPYILSKFDLNSDQISKLLSLRFWFSILLIVGAVGLSLVLPYPPEFSKAVIIGVITILLSANFSTTNLVFQSKLRYDLSSLSNALGSMVVIPIIWYLISVSSPAYYLLLGPVIGWVVINLVSLLLANKSYTLNLQPFDLAYSLKLVKSVWPLSLTLLLNTLYFRIDSFLISSYHGFAEAGIYNLAYQIFQTAIILPTFIMNSYYPLMLKNLNQDKEKFRLNIIKAGTILLSLGFIGTVLTWTLSGYLITPLFGRELPGTISSLIILGFSFPAFFLTALLMWTLVALGRYKVILLVYTVGLVANLILNYIFIPKYSYIAAAYTTGICEYLILFMLLAFLVRYLRK